MNRRHFLTIGTLLLADLAATGQGLDLPEISWTCPMHQDVVEARKGKCPICGMDLVAVRLDTTWTCPVHSVIDEPHGGACPICGRDLVRVSVGLTFTCAENPKINRLNPGKCADGSPTIKRHSVRPHGNHNPQHGGQFFMAADNWHHLEGTLVQNDLFRLYVYDDYSKPLPRDQFKTINVSIAKGNAIVPLQTSARGDALEARLDAVKLPAEFVVKVKFARGGPEYRFDFSFTELTDEHAAAIAPGPSQPIEIPEKSADILSLLGERDRQIQALIGKGAFAEIYVPAFQAKDLALALELQTTNMTARKRAAVTSAVERLVRAAWQLDAAGDQGDRAAIDAIYSSFKAACDEIRLAFGSLR